MVPHAVPHLHSCYGHHGFGLSPGHGQFSPAIPRLKAPRRLQAQLGDRTRIWTWWRIRSSLSLDIVAFEGHRKRTYDLQKKRHRVSHHVLCNDCVQVRFDVRQGTIICMCWVFQRCKMSFSEVYPHLLLICFLKYQHQALKFKMLFCSLLTSIGSILASQVWGRCFFPTCHKAQKDANFSSLMMFSPTFRHLLGGCYNHLQPICVKR